MVKRSFVTYEVIAIQTFKSEIKYMRNVFVMCLKFINVAHR